MAKEITKETRELAERFTALIPLYNKCEEAMELYAEISGGAYTGDKDKDRLCSAISEVCETGERAILYAFSNMLDSIDNEDEEEFLDTVKNASYQTGAYYTGFVKKEQIDKAIEELMHG